MSVKTKITVHIPNRLPFYPAIAIRHVYSNQICTSITYCVGELPNVDTTFLMNAVCSCSNTYFDNLVTVLNYIVQYCAIR